MEFYHEPIMLNEIISGLNLQPTDVFVDCTLGGAGHSSEIIKHIPQGFLVGIDRDDDALSHSAKRLKQHKNKAIVKSDFKDFANVLNNLEIHSPNKILVDLGVSSHQLDTAERGFSFRFDAPLDMRMDQTQEKTAWHVVNFYPKEKLLKILREYGEEKFANLIVANILKHRKEKTIDTTGELNTIIEECLPKKYIFTSGGAAKKTFQAIRIEVNGELEGLERALQDMIDRLAVGGRLAVLTFHSLEDRIAKNIFRENATDCICPPESPICICGHKAKIKILNKKPIVASAEEQTHNPRSTSAKLRIVEKI
ncbi:MAG: 16S rRNA (cytosine(1402)-N(4))-methyltransferase RsmH [Clostridia bacterium]|nr:16S rRNA (cytosine(1402)-N(4))-methyltransferase RsmH [Clostridia bacterium]